MRKRGRYCLVVDRSVTAAGARLLYRRVTTPSQRLDAISEARPRLSSFSSENSGVRTELYATCLEAITRHRARLGPVGSGARRSARPRSHLITV